MALVLDSRIYQSINKGYQIWE